MCSFIRVILKRPAGRPPKCVCSKNEDLQAKIGEKSIFFENWKNAPKSSISWGVSVPKMEKFYTTFFALPTLRPMSDILTTFTIKTRQQTPTFGVFFVTFNHPRSFNLSEYTITFSIIPVRSVWSNMRRFLRLHRYLILWIIMVNGDVRITLIYQYYPHIIHCRLIQIQCRLH